MTLPVNRRQILLDWMVTKLEGIDGGTDYNFDVTTLPVKVHRALDLSEAIGQEMCPYVFAAAGNGTVRMGLGFWYEADCELVVVLFMRQDAVRFGSGTADQNVEKLLADALKAMFATAKEPTTSAYPTPNRPAEIEKDMDEEGGRWSQITIRSYWTFPQANRGT